MIIGISFGCQKDYSNHDNSMTQASLTMWHELIAAVLVTKSDRLQYKTINEIIDSWQAKEFIGKNEAYTLRQDDWQNEFQFAWQEKADRYIVRITSAGRNQHFENGEGDDLYLEIEIKDFKMLSAKVRIINRHGRPEFRQLALESP